MIAGIKNFGAPVSGFTLIEILVIAGVVSILSGILILYSRLGENQIILFRDRAVVIGTIFRAKSLSIATFGEPAPPCGYGVHFEAPRQMIIFKDLAEDCVKSDRIYSGDGERIAEATLDDVVQFDNLVLRDILFVPPVPTIFMNPNQDQVSIVLRLTKGGGSAAVKITRFGQITAL